MPFVMPCPNKGCHKTMEPYLDPKSDIVYCSECDNEMSNITHFAKIQMKTLKQFKNKTIKSFSIKCTNCGKEDRPKLMADDIVCSACSKPHTHLSEAFRLMLKEQLKTVGRDV